MDVLKSVSTRHTPQSQPAGRATVKNAAGGFVFEVDDHTRLHRFLTLGTDGGTYYTSAPELTQKNADVVFRLAKTEPDYLVETIVEISSAGRAPRQNPAIFALAIAASAELESTRAYALSYLPVVCRTASSLFTFIGYIEQFRGWGPQLKRAVANWYLSRPTPSLAYQMVKYRQRDGMTHRDVLRLVRGGWATDENAERMALMNWACGRRSGTDRNGQPTAPLPQLIDDFERLQAAKTATQAVDAINESIGVSWEMVPTQLLNQPSVWEALLGRDRVPQGALIRQLPRLTRIGVIKGATGAMIASRLVDAERLTNARVHPINVLVALRNYSRGYSAAGHGDTWTPDRRIMDALDAAFYNAYGAVQASGKRILLALDVSGSMDSHNCSGLPLTAREAVGALAMVTTAVEPEVDIIGFTGVHERVRSPYGGSSRVMIRANGVTELDISPRRRLDDNARYMRELPMGRTDCALPFLWALENRRAYDAVVIMTDNESWAGPVHVHQALRDYRAVYGPTRLVAVAATATHYSVADEQDALSLNVSGFDSAVPNVIADFAGGAL